MGGVVTLEDIAKELKVSIVTVSNALAGRSGVSEELRERIVQKAREMGYRKKNRREKKTPSSSRLYQNGVRIGVAIPHAYLEKYTSFYWELYQRVATEASRQGCFVLLEILMQDREKRRELPLMIAEKQVDALIALGMLDREYTQMLAEKAGCPMLLLDFDYDEVPCDAVISNGFFGAYQMTNYLIRMGHTRIGFVGECRATGSIMDRYQGFSKSLLEHGIQEKKEWVVADRDYITGDTILRLPEELPTAFVCNSDFTAEKVAALLKEAGYAVPEDISLVGYDDFLVTGAMQGKLTTYAVDMDDMAHQSIKLLLKRLSGDSQDKIVRTVDGRPVYRNSVKHL